jgi:hypothetical protein
LAKNPSQSPEEIARVLVSAHKPIPGTQTVALSSNGFRAFAAEFVGLVQVLLEDDTSGPSPWRWKRHLNR